MRPKKKFATNRIGDDPIRPATQEEIAGRAYAIWLQEGRPDGREVVHWLQAEAHLRLARRQDAGQPVSITV